MAGFRNILGHESEVELLQKAVMLGKVSHAYIFEGEAGCGKKELAEAFMIDANPIKFQEQGKQDSELSILQETSWFNKIDWCCVPEASFGYISLFSMQSS